MKRLLILAALLMAGCPSSGTPQIGPTVGPSLSRALVMTSGQALEGDILRLTFKGNGQALTGVKSSLYGLTLGYGNSMNTSATVFSPLIPGTYRAIAYAPGYAVTEIADLAFPADLATQSIEREVTLAPGGTVTGRALDASGNPLWGARITSGLATAYSGADGRFTLEGVPQGAATVRIAKTRFSPTTRAATVSGSAQDLGDISLTGVTTGFYLYNPADTLGSKTTLAALASMRTQLSNNGFPEVSQSTAKIWLLVAPKTLSSEQTQEIANFVAAGNKLVVLGEWGGYGGYSPNAINLLLSRYGINILPDLVKSTQNLGQTDWIRVKGFAETPLSAGLTEIDMFSAGSVFAVPPAIPVASTGTGGYRLQAMSGIDVAAAAIAGDGFVIAVGDSSVLTDDSTAGTGSINFNQQNNPTFVLNLFGW